MLDRKLLRDLWAMKGQASAIAAVMAAGVTMFVALASLLTGKCVRSDVAMTGEITLRGLVLPVGGIKEKLLAAHRAGIKRVIIPERNVKDLIDVPDQAKREMEIVSVKRMDELLTLALTELPESLKGILETRGEPVPDYVVVAEEGPDHRKQFRVRCVVAGAVSGEGVGFSKKAAQQEAARRALEALGAKEGA